MMINKTPLPEKPTTMSPISKVFVENQSYLKRFLRRFLSRSHDIEDVVQETYLRARHAEDANTIINSPKSFLFRVARNEALGQLRKKSQRITDYIEELDGDDTLAAEHSQHALEDQIISQQRLGIFCESALEMAPRCRRVFLMVKVYGYSYKEVSQQLGISVSGVEKHVAKGFQICTAYTDRMERTGRLMADPLTVNKNKQANVMPFTAESAIKDEQL